MTLAVNNIDLAIGEKTLLRGISFNLEAGELLAVIGPNGAGKTSLLKGIAGELVSSVGSVTIGGTDIGGLSLQDRARTMAVLPQLSLLNFPYTVEEVIVLGRSPHATGAQRDEAIVAETMARMDILHLGGRLYTQLSGGEKQRVQLARVMAQVWQGDTTNPGLLLLDEPTGALDLGHQQLLMHTLQTLATQGIAMLMTVHDINIAAAYADRILALKDGCCVAMGVPEEVITGPIMKELYNVDLRILSHPDSAKPVALGI
ncbi:MAG: heme ABC transporter ATP-binding protein [Cellvibrionaceae bacterium]